MPLAGWQQERALQGSAAGPSKARHNRPRARHVLAHASSDEEPRKSERPTLNPIELGRRSRKVIDDAWSTLTRLGSSSASFTLDDDLGADVSSDAFRTPQAEFTNVLVVGGTGRVGLIVVRKLLLRGYTVRVMVRDSGGSAAAMLPASVELFRGDVSHLPDCLAACTGMDKVCMRALHSYS